MRRSHRFAIRTLLLVAALSSSLLATAARADYDESYQFQTKHLRVVNLIGEIHVEPASGSSFEVELQARGKDAQPGTLEVERKDGRHALLTVKFPLEDSRDYVYPRWGSRSSSTIDAHNGDKGSWIGRILGRDRIKIRGRGHRGTELYADLTIRVPEGTELEVYHGAGEILAKKVHADLELDSEVGGIHAEDVEGDLLADTGSGAITATGIRGDVNADTGSGSIELVDVRSHKVLADTGSGAIDLQDVEADEVSADTGSGSVGIDQIQVGKLLVDTGSGRVEVTGLSCDGMNIDTGSGSVTVELVHAGDGRFRVDTGSGSIRLDVPADLSADIKASSSSGSVQVDVADVDIHRRDHDEVHFTMGGGAADFELDAGSGGVRIASR